MAVGDSHRSVRHALYYATLVAFIALMLFPLYWMLVTSFKPNIEIYHIPPRFFPDSLYLDHYARTLEDGYFVRYLWNNFIVASITTLVNLIAATLAGYSISRYPTRITAVISFGLLSTQMFPVVGIVIALYTLYLRVSMLNTHTGLILVLTATTIPFTTWMLKGFFDELPKSIEDSAFVDGASRLTVLTRIALPLAKPGLLAAGLYSFMLAWNDFLFGLTLISSDRLRTLSVGISLRYLGEVSYDWGQVTTVAVFGTVPMFVLFFLFQRYLVEGLTAGAVKG